MVCSDLYKRKMAAVSEQKWAFNWDDEALNAAELNSPQPCQHGAGCTYFGSCRFVHPGEEGTGRMLFELRVVTQDNGSKFTQPACVRLIGSPGFYRRRRAQMSWPEFCARNGIPYTPNPSPPRHEEEADAEETSSSQYPAPSQHTPRGGGGWRGGRSHGPRVHSSYRGPVAGENPASRGRIRRGQWVGLPQP